MTVESQNGLNHGHTCNGASPLFFKGLNQILSIPFHYFSANHGSNFLNKLSIRNVPQIIVRPFYNYFSLCFMYEASLSLDSE